jgi:hypothetical protein
VCEQVKSDQQRLLKAVHETVVQGLAGNDLAVVADAEGAAEGGAATE